MQKNIFIATLDNYDKILANTKSAEESEGVAMQKQAIYMESLTAKLTQLKETFNQFYLTVANSSTLKAFVDMSTGIIGGLNKIAGAVGALPVAFGLATFAISTFSTHATINQAKMTNLMLSFLSIIPPIGRFTQALRTSGIDINTTTGRLFVFSGMLNTLKGAILNTNLSLTAFRDRIRSISFASIIAGLRGATGGFLNLTKAIIGSRIAMAALQMVGIMIVVTAISTLISKLGQLYTSAEEAKKALNNLSVEIQNLKSGAVEVGNLLGRLETLQMQESLNAEESQELLEVQRKIAELLPNTATGYDKEGKAISENADLIRKQIDLNKQLLEIKQQTLISKVKKSDELAQYKQDNDELQDLLEKRKSAIDSQSSTGIFKSLEERGINNLNEQIDALLPKLAETRKTYIEAMTAIDETTDGTKLGIANINALFETIKDNENVDITKLIPDLKKSGFVDELKRAKDELDGLSKSGKQDDLTKRYKELTDSLSKLLQFEGLSGEDGLSFLNDVFKIPALSTATKDLKEFTDSTITFNTELKKQTQELGELNQLIYDNANGQKIQGDRIMDLILKYPDLTEAMVIQNGQVSFSAEGLKKLRIARIEEMQTALEAELRKTNMTQSSVASRLKNYGVEINALTTLAQAQDALAKGRAKLEEQAYKSSDGGIGQALVAQFNSDESALLKVMKSKETMNKLINEVFTNKSFGVDTSKVDSASESAQNAAEKEAQAWETLTDEIAKYTDALEEAQIKRKQGFDGIEAKLNAGFLVGADAATEKLKEEETYVNSLFDAYNELQKDIYDWRIKQDKFKPGTREYDLIENKIKEINELQKQSIALSQKETLVLANMKEQWDDLWKPIQAIKDKFTEVEDKIKDISVSFKETIHKLSSEIKMNAIFGDEKIAGTNKDIFDDVLKAYKDRIVSYSVMMDELREVDAEKTEQYLTLSAKQSQGVLTENEKMILADLEKWEVLQQKLVEYGLTQEEIIKNVVIYNELNAINVKQEKEKQDIKDMIQREKDRLDTLREQEDKQKSITELMDKQLKISEIINEIENVKANRSIEIINENGQKQLTYDYAKLDELRKQQAIAEREMEETKKKQASDELKKSIESRISDQQNYLDNILPKIQEAEMKIYTDKWNEVINGQVSMENSLVGIQAIGINERVNLAKQEISALKIVWDAKIQNAFEAGKAETEAYRRGLTGGSYVPTNFSNPLIGSSATITNNIIDIGGVKITGKDADALAELLMNLGLTAN